MEIREFLKKSIEGEMDLQAQVTFLSDFTIDKVKVEDVKEFVDFMQKEMLTSLEMPCAIDICGTGGSGLPRINTSTISALVLARLGVYVAKHGNKSASGRFGSFDLLEAFGVEIDLDKEALEKAYVNDRVAFIYARKFHPAMKHFAEARKVIAEPTIFNIVGPLLNPANPKMQIIGTSFEDKMHLIAEVCKAMGKTRVMVVRGCDGLDEVTLSGETKVVELRDGKISEYVIRPEDFGVKSCNFEEVAGGDLKRNLRIAKEILAGECRSRHADLVHVNCALALKLIGRTEDLKQAMRIARGSILDLIAADKVLRKSDRDFKAAIAAEGVSLIAEIKKASPSEGMLMMEEFNAAQIGEIYEDEGVGAISVLTDERYFHGSFNYLADVQAVTEKTPLLCKDFIVDEYQIKKARDFGADAVLLIAALLSVDEIRRFLDVARGLAMDCLCEVHREEDLYKVLQTDAEIIGINNRNLKDFKVDFDHSAKIVDLIPEGKLIVAESGIKSGEDLKKLSPRVNAVLVGTALMKADNLRKKINEFI